MNFLEALRTTTRHITQYVNNLVDERMSETKGLKVVLEGNTYAYSYENDGVYRINVGSMWNATYVPDNIIAEIVIVNEDGYMVYKDLFLVPCIGQSYPYTSSKGSASSAIFTFNDGDMYVDNIILYQQVDEVNPMASFRIFAI